MLKRRVVVTGLGVKSSVGNDYKSFFDGLKNGKNGIKPISFIDSENVNINVAAYDYEFDPLKYFNKKDLRRMDRFCQFALAATKDLLDGQDVLNFYDPYKV